MEDEENTGNSNESSKNEESNNNPKKKKFLKGLKENLVMVQQEGSVSSSTSSISRNLDKYNYFEDFLRASNMPFSIKLIGIIRVLEYFALLITTLILLIIVYSSFDNLVSDINQLSLNSELSFHYYDYLAFSNNFLANVQSSFYPTSAVIASEFTILSDRLYI